MPPRSLDAAPCAGASACRRVPAAVSGVGGRYARVGCAYGRRGRAIVAREQEYSIQPGKTRRAGIVLRRSQDALLARGCGKLHRPIGCVGKGRRCKRVHSGGGRKRRSRICMTDRAHTMRHLWNASCLACPCAWFAWCAAGRDSLWQRAIQRVCAPGSI